MKTNRKSLARLKSRILNFSIDIFLVYILSFFLIKLFLKVWKYISPEIELIIPINAFFLFSFFVYYLLSEYFFKKTIGKLITRTSVVNIDGNVPSLIQILIRTIVRLLFIFDMMLLVLKKQPERLHDLWSNTIVVKDNVPN